MHLNNSLLQSGISKHSKYYSFIGREKNPEFLGPSIFLNEYEDASLGNNHILEQFWHILNSIVHLDTREQRAWLVKVVQWIFVEGTPELITITPR